MNNLSVPNKYHALLIGVDDYPSQPLYSCVNDVCRIKNFLEIKKSGQVNIMTLTATKGAPLGDSEQRPTYTNIDSALKTIETQAKAGDFAYVHFSGHGTTEKTQYKHSNKLTGDLALCILNKDGKEVCLKGTVFANGLNKLVEKGIIVTVVLDCCFSASVYRSGDHDIRYLPYDRTITSPRQIQPDSSFMGQNPGSTHRDGSMRDNWLIDPDGYTIFAACGPDEIAKGGSERMENGKRYGALSCFIFNALSKHGLGWRNKDLYRYLCARFREDEQGDKPQNPVLFGNGDQGFFGPVNLHSGERLIGVVQGGANFQLMAGKAHGLREDDRFSISPLGLKGVEGGCTAKITQAGAFTSSLELLDATPRDIQTGWVAQPRTSSYLASFRVYLSHDLPQRAQLLAALGKHSLGTVTEPHSHSVFKVIANNEEYEILDESGQIIINLPIMTDIRGITEVLEHLVWFKMTKDLTNIEPKTSFGKSFDIWIMGDRRYRHGEQIEVEHDGYISVFMKNKGNTDLYVHVYNLSPRWGISNILSKGYEVVPNQNDEHKIREIHMTIPLMMQEHGSCEDIIKVFVTTHPTSFELLELPNLNEQAKQEKRTQNRGTPPNNPIPKDWTAFNFYIHTSGKQTAQDSSKSRGGFRDGLGNGNSTRSEIIRLEQEKQKLAKEVEELTREREERAILEKLRDEVAGSRKRRQELRSELEPKKARVSHETPRSPAPTTLHGVGEDNPTLPTPNAPTSTSNEPASHTAASTDYQGPTDRDFGQLFSRGSNRNLEDVIPELVQFHVDKDMVSLLGQLNNNELCSFSIEYDEPGDAAIELKIYAFFLIFTRTLSPEHLNEAIQCANRWNESLGIDNPDRLRRCQIVDEMITLRTHFRDFQEQYRALFSRNEPQSTVPEEPTIAGIPTTLALNILGELESRFKQTKSIDDLDRAVEVAETYSNAPDNSNRADCFFMLSILLGKRFKITGLPHDLNRAIKAGDNVIENMRQDHPQRHVYLNDIGCRLAERFQLSAGLQLEDFNRAVDMLNTAIDATPDDDPHRATYFNNLGGLFGTWCSRGGTIDDLNRAIDMANVAIDDTSRSPTVRASYFSNLSALLRRRSHMTGSTEDLDRAVELAEMAVAVTPECHPNKAIVLSILGNAFERRFRRAGSIGDLDSSVDAAIRALDAIPEKYPTRTDFLSCFGLRLAMRFERSGAIDDSDLSIAVLDTAVASMPEDYVAKAGCFQNFAHSLRGRYLRTKLMADLDRALEFAEMAIDATPQGDRNRESQFGIRGSLLEMRYQRTGSPEDLDAALSLYKEGWNSHIAPPFRRIYQADRAAAILASQSNWKESSQLLKEALDLLPALSPRSLKHTDKQHMLERSAGLASVAAATYLNAEGVESEEIAYNALRFLELGRGIIAGLLMDMRVDVSDLKRKYPLLADEFESLRDQLDSPIDEDTYRSFDEVSSSWESRVKRRREAEDKFNQVLKTIRTKPEFCNFLLPPTRDELMAAADPDPIVVINLSSYRCDALLVQHNQIRMLKLPRLTLAEARKWARDLRLAHQADITPMLEYLWNAVCRPCLDTLGFRTERDSSDNRRVWWIPTGVLSQLPLHAAGLYSPGSKDTVLDRVMSSYASSIKALIRGRPQCSKSLAPSPTARALLIAMETTPGKGALEFAEREVAMLSQLCPDLKLQPIRPAPRKADVLEHLDNCNIFHFAGHGMSDPQEPSRSTLLLDDWQTNSLTVGDLRDYKVQENRPFLGYLSACSTGSNQIEGLVDEAVHLIGALQLAGFRHVVGTLWEVSDSHCVEVTKVLYETLRSEGLTDIAVCRGLHLAVKKLRDEAVEREGWWRDAEGVDRERSCYWVPYVHFGV